jgi:hypothetical protein
MICNICWWEDDLVQIRWPLWVGGANRPCLIDAQREYIRIGASAQRFAGLARPATDDESLEVTFRPADPSLHNFEGTGLQEAPWPGDRTVLYWWRPTFWR